MGRGVAPRRAWPWGTIWGVVVPLVIFALFAAKAWSGHAFGWESDFLLAVHQRAAPALDRGAIWCSRIFHPQVLVVATALLAGGFALRRRWRWAWAALGLVGGALLLNTVVKEIVRRPRPALWPSPTGEVSSGFPSGHAMTSFAFAALLVAICWRTRWRGPSLLLAPLWLVLIALTRLYLGVHYPTDILAGWCLASAWVTTVWLLALRA